MTSERRSSLEIGRNVNGLRRHGNRAPPPTDWTTGITVKRYVADQRQPHPLYGQLQRYPVVVKSPPTDSVAIGELPVDPDDLIIRAISAESSHQFNSQSVGKSVATRSRVSRVTPVTGSPNRRHQQTSAIASLTTDLSHSNHQIGQFSLTIKPVNATNGNALTGSQLNNYSRNHLPNGKVVVPSDQCHRKRESGGCSTHVEDCSKQAVLMTSSNGTSSSTSRTLDVFLPPINQTTNDD